MSVVAWLTAPEITSPRQARAQRLYALWRAFRTNPMGLPSALVILALILAAAAAPLLARHDPYVQDLATRLRPPDRLHILGTDELGRDVFARLVFGARTSLAIAFLVAAIVGPVGLLIGTVAGYLGGWTDRVLMRLVDLFLAFPGLILALAFIAALGPGVDHAIMAVSLTAWPPIARLARAETLTIRKTDYIAAARLTGASWPRVVLRHIMPMCLPSVIVRLTLNMAGIVLTAAGLSFLGLGARPPAPEWGAMLSTGRQYLLGAWWLAAAPGLAIMMLSLAFNLLGDSLRDALDPRRG